MKDLTISLLLLALCAACSKSKPDDPIDPPPPPIDTVSHIIELGKGSVLRNSVAWNAAFYASYNINDRSRFSVGGIITQNGAKHHFGIGDISSKVGLQHIERRDLWNGTNGIPNAHYYVILDDDQLLNSYDVDTTRANQYIEVLRYDSITHVVEGRFQAFLEGPTTWAFLPDSIAMTEGKFHLKINQ